MVKRLVVEREVPPASPPPELFSRDNALWHPVPTDSPHLSLEAYVRHRDTRNGWLADNGWTRVDLLNYRQAHQSDIDAAVAALLAAVADDPSLKPDVVLTETENGRKLYRYAPKTPPRKAIRRY